MNAQPPKFKEVQRLRTWWLVLLILIPTFLVWWGAVQQMVFGIPWGNNPAPDDLMIFLVAVFGVAFPLFILGIKMTVEVTDVITITFSPFRFKRRTITAKEISQHRAMQYRPIAEYGGWGIKGTFSNTAYNMQGNSGVKLFLDNGKTLMIGSLRAEELDMAIGAMMREAL
ncbi:MAG: DUF6141 family protein [Methanomassiliicoccales archaeon]|nr:DUF6141 family protein [Methanomassiliicoccales archaeon]